MTAPERCTCAECVGLDATPERLQGIPGAWQLRLFPERRHRNGKLQRPRKAK